MYNLYAQYDYNSGVKLNPESSESTDTHVIIPVLKVVGLGGGGSNAINRMIELGLKGIDYIAANTDYQALKNCAAPVKIQLGPSITRGLGAGGNPITGRAAAKESAQEIADALKGADMVFLTAGMGGGTGTGSIPIAAEISRNLGAVTIAVVTTPFTFEMGQRQKNAKLGINELRQLTHTLITIPNDRLLYVAPRDLPLEVAFRLADDVLRQAVQGIAELITEPGLINVDFSHVRKVMLIGGGALMSIGQGEGQNKAKNAIDQALHHPLLDEVSLDHATGVIINFTGSPDLSLFEVEEAVTYLKEKTSHNADVVLGVINDDRLGNRVQVILIVTGMGALSLEEALSSIATVNLPSSYIEKVNPITPAMGGINNEPSFLEMAAMSSSHNLDVPAFIRRRAKLTG